jgi:hypothetical protein
MWGSGPMAQEFPGNRVMDAETGGGKGPGVDKNQGWQLAGVTNQQKSVGTRQDWGELGQSHLIAFVTDQEVAPQRPRSGKYGQLGDSARQDRHAIAGAKVEATSTQGNRLRF